VANRDLAELTVSWTSEDILRVLDACCEAFTFPALDNGYVYLAASRLRAFRSLEDWAITIEVFGFSPRAGIPDVCVYTFASRFAARPLCPPYTRDQNERHEVQHPHDAMIFVHPVELGASQDVECNEYVASDATSVLVRGQERAVPDLDQYPQWGIQLQQPPRVHVFELCRGLAALHRADLLATEEEVRQHLPDELEPILLLDEWLHPDLIQEEFASDSQTFIDVARVLATGDASAYRSVVAPNTHWTNWPEGGSL
jgi:hypothetical protein